MLAEIGRFARRRDLRLTMHPGQFTLLSAPDPTIVANSRRDLAWQAGLLDGLGLNRAARLVTHVGGAYGDRQAAVDSSQASGQKAGAHAEYINAEELLAFLAAAPQRPFDCMLETKAKDLALLRLRDQLATAGVRESGAPPASGKAAPAS